MQAATEQGVRHLADAVRKALHCRSFRGAAEPLVDYWSGAGALSAMPVHRQQAVAERMESVSRHFGALFGEPATPTEVAKLAGLDLPILFLTGERTVESTRRIAALLRRAGPRDEHEAMADLAHMSPLTHAAAVNRRIQDFLLLHGSGS